MINDLETSVMFCGAGFGETGETLKGRCGIENLVDFNENGSDSGYERGLAGATPGTEMVEQSLDDTCTILYTSGTTGRPKGACITHGAVLFNAVNASSPTRITPDSVGLVVLPMFHVSGLNIFANPIFHAGGTNLVVRTVDPPQLLRLIGDEALGISHFIAVPTVLQFMAVEPGFSSTDFSRVVCPLVGGSPVPEALLQTCFDAGMKLMHAYGMTETGPTVLALDADDAQRKIGSAGKPVTHMEVQLVKPDGRAATTGEVGEIWLRGPSIIREYWRRPEANQTDFTDGWLHTGDAAYRDDEGFYHIVDRWKDMYISGGENVYPAEVESVISRLPEVLMASAIGVPDERWGETGCAFIVLKQNALLTADDVIAHCLENLAKYKAPKTVHFVRELPQNASGKILKTELRKPEWRNRDH
jgi:fatty-acyl-CoA synthase